MEIEIEITRNIGETGQEQPVLSPAPQPVSESNNFWEILVGVTLIIGAGAIITATIAEDVVTAGAGVADDPVSFAAAAAIFARGLAFMKTVRTGTAIRIQHAVVLAH